MIKCCKGCQKREVGCHGKCETYAREKEAHINDTVAQNVYMSNHDYREDVRIGRKLKVVRLYGDKNSKEFLGLYQRHH